MRSSESSFHTIFYVRNPLHIYLKSLVSGYKNSSERGGKVVILGVFFFLVSIFFIYFTY